MRGGNLHFVAWLRRTRRSAWLLIALCLIYQLGDGVLRDASASVVDSAASAEVGS